VIITFPLLLLGAGVLWFVLEDRKLDREYRERMRELDRFYGEKRRWMTRYRARVGALPREGNVIHADFGGRR
jgi:hypothetical protein